MVLQQCCPCIITRLGPPILLVTGIPYIRGPCTQLCLRFWLLGEPSSPGPVPMAQEWQSPWGSSPVPPLPPALLLPLCPRTQGRNCTRHRAPSDQWLPKLLLPLPLAFPHKAGDIKAGTVALLMGQDCLFKPVGMRTVGSGENFCPRLGEIWLGCREWMELALYFLWVEIWPCHRDTSLMCSQDASLSLVNVF